MDIIWRQNRFAWIAQLPNASDERGNLAVEVANPAIQELCNRLLELGGTYVCVPFAERDCRKLLQRAKVFPTAELELKIGESNACHSNSAQLWNQNHTGYYITTGYALTSEDWMWRQHSWLTDDSAKIIETVSPRFTYFGMVLNYLETLIFCRAN